MTDPTQNNLIKDGFTVDDKAETKDEDSTVIGPRGCPQRGGVGALSEDNPFRPRVSLSRSPVRQAPGPGPAGDLDVDVFLGSTSTMRDAGPASRTETAAVATLAGILSALERGVQETMAASRKIYEYAATTKNVKGLLREQSDLALRSLDRMRQQLAHLRGGDPRCEGLAIIGNRSRSKSEGEAARRDQSTTDAGTQTEASIASRQALPPRDGLGVGRLPDPRMGPPAVQKANNRAGAGRKLGVTGAGGVEKGDKRKEISPPEPARTKRLCPSKKTGISPLARGGLRDLTNRGGTILLADLDRVIPPQRNDTGTDEAQLRDTVGDCLPSERQIRRRGATLAGLGQLHDGREKTRRGTRALYSDILGRPYTHPATRGGPLERAYHSRELWYLRRTRIPHWEWRQYSSGVTSEEDDSETNMDVATAPTPTPRPTAYQHGRSEIGRCPTVPDEYKEGERTRPARRRKRARRRLKPEAVMVRVDEGASYLDTYRAIAVDLKAHPGWVRSVRKTRAGHLLIEAGQGTKVAEIGGLVRSRLGGGSQVKMLQETTTFQLRGLDPIIGKEEVAADLAEAGKLDRAEVQVLSLKPMRDGTQTAIAKVPTRKISGELRSGRIRIGLVICRSKILPEVKRCFRCHQFGHIGAECKTLEPGKSLCRKCGLEGHSMNLCCGTPKCVLCTKMGMVGANARHVAGALNCPSYRERLLDRDNG